MQLSVMHDVYHSILTKTTNYGSSNKKLRSLFIFGKSLTDYSGFRLLIVLEMHNCLLRLEGQKWFKELIQLRYLGFFDCEIVGGSQIPKEICHMQNLQTLNCEKTWYIELPESLWSIKTLKHVRTNCTETLPPPSDDLTFTNLQTLQDVRLEHTQGELYSFPSLYELGLRNYGKSWDPIIGLLRNKTLRKLVHLSMIGRDVPLDVVDMRRFIFFEHLQCLELWGLWCHYVSLRAHFFPSCLTKLLLGWCEFTEDPMPELGKLQNLKILSLGYKAYIGRQMTCPVGGFPQLRELILWGQENVDINIEEGTMSMLKRFKIALRSWRIPDVQHLTKLEEFTILMYEASFSEEEIQKMRQENQHKLNHIRAVVIKRF
ncbi:CC-NBS-LRR class disease resistance protein [Rhynchospora pubera]|uniref:CC-NBS-LRR class disease resistance protein n=1 Tax=Rhynchospora pubera TaxID=906938 RepID=A0AAV8ERI6_9POAL|nr:CC-NBS-LRR class disease resistance protein [Rhynchospora pubera]